MKTDFKVYPRKIHVFAVIDGLVMHRAYQWSTNAYKTCREAIAAAKALHPGREFVANFAKD